MTVHSLANLCKIFAALLIGFVGCSKPQQTYNGLILFAPFNSTETQLLDNEFTVAHRWKSDFPPGQCVYLLRDGSLLRSARMAKLGSVFEKTYSKGSGGRVDWFNWDGSIRWTYELNTEAELLHHDIEPMPNGNFLMLVWVHIPHETAAKVGCVTSSEDLPLLSERIIEIDPSTSEIVWQWSAWDHIYQKVSIDMPNYSASNNPRRFDVNVKRDPNDWLHFNSLSYDERRDLIAISCRQTSEILIIDHSTTSSESRTGKGGKRGFGGDIFARWGNSPSEERVLFNQHNANWIDENCPGAGNILLFNNGGPKRKFSDVLELSFDDRSGTFEVVWEYHASPPSSLYSEFVSSAQRLPNGNTLICSGCEGRTFEIDRNNRQCWSFTYPVSGREDWVFRVEKYGREFLGGSAVKTNTDRVESAR